MQKISDSHHFFDLASLDSLRNQSQKNDTAALKKVAQQFEAVFVQMLMKSMRSANAVLESESPLNNQYTQFYQQMHDQQMSMDLSNKGLLGLSDLIVKQLSSQPLQDPPNKPLRSHVMNKMPSLTSDHSQLKHQQGEKLPPINHFALSDNIRINDGKNIDENNRLAYFSSPQDFIFKLHPLAEKAAEKLGTKTEVILAQAALETGWGKKIIMTNKGHNSFNLFNIKAGKSWDGPRSSVSTIEFESGIASQQQASFRVYDSFADSFNDFVDYIQHSTRYEQARNVSNNPNRFIQELHLAGYATDPNYSQKVIGIMARIPHYMKENIQITNGNNK